MNIEKAFRCWKAKNLFISQGRTDKNVKLNEFHWRKFSLYLFSEDHEWIKWVDENSSLFMNKTSIINKRGKSKLLVQCKIIVLDQKKRKFNFVEIKDS